MTRRKFVDTDAAPRLTRSDPTLAKRKLVSDVIYYEAPKSHATKFKLALGREELTDTTFPKSNNVAQQGTTHKHDEKKEPVADSMADDKALSGLAEQLAAYSPIKLTKSWVLEKKDKVGLTGVWGWQEKLLPVSQRRFKCFGRLPVELRLLIWKQARPDPRIVKVAWSKQKPHVPEYLRFSESEIEKVLWSTDPEFRANYSKTPIPSMLHACTESRKVALGWYQLALQPLLAEPHIYFDFSADYLDSGCDNCPTRSCYDCKFLINSADEKKISKILFRWPWQHDPFFNLFLHFRRVKEVLLFDAPVVGIMPPDIQLHNFKESTKLFKWQGMGKRLFDIFLSRKEEFDSLIDKHNKLIDEENARCSWDLLYPGCFLTPLEIYFRPEKFTRVEIDFKPDLPEG